MDTRQPTPPQAERQDGRPFGAEPDAVNQADFRLASLRAILLNLDELAGKLHTLQMRMAWQEHRLTVLGRGVLALLALDAVVLLCFLALIWFGGAA